MKLSEALIEAAARGVDVTIITNDHPMPQFRFKWQFKEYRDGAIGTFMAAGFKATVFDMDGDASEWTLKRGKVVLAEGSTYECRPFYHFDACVLAAEEALLAAARERRLALRKEAPDAHR